MTREGSSQPTRQRIVDAVTALVVEEHPATISVPAVARRAGVSVATVYRYFPDKERLLDAAAEVGNQKRVAEYAGRRVDEEGVDELVARSFWELADHLPLVREQQQSAAGRDLRRRRRPVKRRELHARVRDLGLDPATAGAQRLMTLIELLASSATLLELHDHQGLPVDGAAADVAWAIRMLVRATREAA